MEEARDIFHPKLNGKWQVSDFCKFLSLNSDTSADRDVKAPTWKSSKIKNFFSTNLKCKIFFKGGGEGKGQRGQELLSVEEKCGLYPAGSWRGSLLVQPLQHGAFARNTELGAGFSFCCAGGASCSWGSSLQLPAAPWRVCCIQAVTVCVR